MIARVIGIGEDTLRKYYSDDLSLGEAQATAKVAQTLYSKAVKGDTASCIFWLKARAKWSERVQTQQLGADGQPIDPRQTFVLTVER